MWKLSVIATFVTGCVLVPIPADACEFKDNQPDNGVLTGDSKLGGVVPRNVAFFVHPTLSVGSGKSPKGTEADPWLVAKLSDGTPIVAVALPNGKVGRMGKLAKPLEPLPANAGFSVIRWPGEETAYTTSDRLDSSPPSQPEVIDGVVNFHKEESGCQQSSCGDYTSITIHLKNHATDDLTPAERLVYAIYLGQTAEEAATKVEFDGLHTSATEMWSLIDPVWFDRNVFLAVAAIDQAANFSQRSVALKIHSSDNDGCSMQHPRRRLPIQAILPVMAVALWLVRRVRRNSGH